MRRRLRNALLCSIALSHTLASIPADAHDPGLSTSVWTIQSDRIEFTLRIHVADSPKRGSLGAFFALRDDHGIARQLDETTIEQVDDHFVCRGAFAVPRSDLWVRAPQLDSLPNGHKHIVLVETATGDLVANQVLPRGGQVMILASALSPSRPAGNASSWFSAFVALGVEHVLLGADHLLFLLALLLFCSGLGAAARIVTTFTIAHSITLALAVLGVASLPAAIVEPAIAASIVYVALSGVVRGNDRGEPLVLVFGFGLVHGLGFAGALAPLLPASGPVLTPLIGFNLGVELGQVAIVAIVLPLLTRLRKLSPVASAAMIRTSAIGSAAAGGFWLLQRTIG